MFTAMQMFEDASKQPCSSLYCANIQSIHDNIMENNLHYLFHDDQEQQPYTVECTDDPFVHEDQLYTEEYPNDSFVDKDQLSLH